MLFTAVLTVASARIARLRDSGACMDSADQAKWKGTGETNFASDLKTCGLYCLGAESCVTTCIEKKGYTNSCAACFGTLTSCSKTNCEFQCFPNSQSAACKTCVDDHCTPAFETCSGLTPPSNLELTTTPKDACKDSADQAKWKGTGETNFASDLKACGLPCIGAESCVTTCIEKKGYTATCAACFGTLTNCSKNHCEFKCYPNSQSAACKTCVDKNCTPAFETCSGLTPPSN